MCYNVEVYLTRQQIEEQLEVPFPNWDGYDPNYYYNGFTFPMLPVLSTENLEQVQLYQWGLIPFWVKTEADADKIRRRTLNARSETIDSKPSYRSAVKKNRCLIIVGGFYEWEHRGREKIPHYIYLKSKKAMLLAGIFDRWINPETAEVIHTFSIATTDANPMMQRIHNSKKRMPVILNQAQSKIWLDTELPLSDSLQALSAFDENEMQAHSISKLITTRGVDKNTPRLIEPFPYL